MEPHQDSALHACMHIGGMFMQDCLANRQERIAIDQLVCEHHYRPEENKVSHLQFLNKDIIGRIQSIKGD